MKSSPGTQGSEGPAHGTAPSDPERLEVLPEAAWSPVVRSQAERMLGILRPVVRVARLLARLVLLVALLSTIAAALILVVIGALTEPPAPWGSILLLLAGAVLLSPGAVLVVFHFGLRQLILIPSEISRNLGDLDLRPVAASASSALRDVGGGRWRALIHLYRSLVEARSLLLGTRELAAKAVVLVRVANPVSMFVMLGATAACLMIILAGVILAIGIAG